MTKQMTRKCVINLWKMSPIQQISLVVVGEEMCFEPQKYENVLLYTVAREGGRLGVVYYPFNFFF